MNVSGLILNNGVSNLEKAQQDLTWSVTGGSKNETYADMNSDQRSTVLSLTPKLTQISSFQSNIADTNNHLDVTSDSLNAIIKSGNDMAASILSMSHTPDKDINMTDISLKAKSSLKNLGSILNTSTGDRYIFSGSNYQKPPVKNINKPIQAIGGYMVSNLTSGSLFSGASSVLNANSPYQGFMSHVYPINVQIGESRFMKAGIMGNATPVKNLIRDFAMIANFNKFSNLSDKQFMPLMKNMHDHLINDTNGIIKLNSKVGFQQDTLKSQNSFLKTTKTAFNVQLGNARNTNLADAAVKMQDVQTSLKASFMLIANIRNLQLANYIQ